MPVTTVVNNMTVVHKSSIGIATNFPDVCKTPCAPSPVPIPYPNIAMSTDAAQTASSVKSDGNPIMIKTSTYGMSTGDEAGSLMGVVSNKVKGTANPTMFSFDVKAEGKNVFRQLDMMLQNGNPDPNNTAPIPTQNQPNAGMGVSEEKEEYDITEVKFDKTKCKCGDIVKVQIKTENYENDDPCGWVVIRVQDQERVFFCLDRVWGNKINEDWIARYGNWRKPISQFKLRAIGRGGPKESSGKLEIEIPLKFEDTEKQVGFQATAQELVITPVGPSMHKLEWRQLDTYTWDWGYDYSIKDGKFTIECKVKLNPKSPRLTIGRIMHAKRIARRQIENVWDRKWEFHRKDCKRGVSCSCPGGCCLFPINIKCKFVNAGAHASVDLHPGPEHANPGLGWDAGNWFEDPYVLGNAGNPPFAHEFGHLIGMQDEYKGAATLRAFQGVPGSIMDDGARVMIQHITKHPGHGAPSILENFEKAAGDKYDVLPI